MWGERFAEQPEDPCKRCLRGAQSMVGWGKLRRKSAADFFEDVFSHVDGNDGGNSQGDGIAGAAVDLDGLPVLPDVDPGEEGVGLEVVDLDAVDVAAHTLDDVGEEVVGEG